MDRTELGDRLLSFSVRIIHLVGSLPHNIVGRRIGDQLLRSGTSVGANYEEAQGAESHADFTHKMQIALKEMRESNYWLRVLYTARVLAPHLLENSRSGYRMGTQTIVDSMIKDGLWDPYNNFHMGNAAEICSKILARPLRSWSNRSTGRAHCRHITSY